MIELKGKFNSTKVFTDNIDSETISQIIELLNQDYVAGEKIRIMPDCHSGAGCVIGTTMTLRDKVCPNLVGMDIGCSVTAIQLEETDADLKKLDEVINLYVPAGFEVHDEAITKSDADKILAPVNVELAYRSIGSLGGGELIATGVVKAAHS